MCCRTFSCKKCVKNTPIKRYFLPFIGVLAVLAYEEINELVYYPIVIGFASIILFWNFPWIVYYTASKPLYYEDLFIDIKKLPNYEVDRKIKNRFKFILEMVLIITNSILMGILSDVWLLRTNNHKGFFSILGTTGGIIKIFQIINNTISRFMLKFLRQFVLKESELSRKNKREKIIEVIKLKDIEEKKDEK